MRLTPTDGCLTVGHVPTLPLALTQHWSDSPEEMKLEGAGRRELLSVAPEGAKGICGSLLRALCSFYFELTGADFLFYHTVGFEEPVSTAVRD